MVDLLQYFPYSNPREIQKETLRVLGDNWEKYDVFVIQAPTAFGKTAVAKTLMNAFTSVSVISPTNLLVQQFQAEFPDTCTLTRLDSYRCEEWQRPCPVTRGKLKQFCKGCPAGKDLSTAKYRRGPGVYNYHTFVAHKLHRDVLVVDEAHNLIPFIRERSALKMWQHDFKYPGNMFSAPQIQAWLKTLSPSLRRKKVIDTLEQAVHTRRPEHVAQRGKDWFNGKGTIRGEPEERDCLRLLPVDIRGAPPLFWPRDGAQKIVLLSATISRKDIETLGLSRRKVLYIACESPIPAGRRPIISVPIGAVNRSNISSLTGDMVSYIRHYLLPRHSGEKGLIHATYQQAAIMAPLFADEPRVMFHDRHNRSDIYHQFRASDPREGRVLVASGLYEGIDLPEDAGRWQAVTKIPWPNLGSPAVKYLADQDPDWYLWETLKLVMQATGRICRTPEDKGVTYFLDSSFERLIRDSMTAGLVPEWYLDALAENEMMANSPSSIHSVPSQLQF